MTARRHRETFSLPGAIDDYTRLCREPLSGANNAYSALDIVREGLESAPELRNILRAIAQAGTPQDVRSLVHQVPMSPTNMSTRLNTLWLYELLTREGRSIPTGGKKYVYVLSPFGHMVLGHRTRGTRHG